MTFLNLSKTRATYFVALAFFSCLGLSCPLACNGATPSSKPRETVKQGFVNEIVFTPSAASNVNDVRESDEADDPSPVISEIEDSAVPEDLNASADDAVFPQLVNSDDVVDDDEIVFESNEVEETSDEIVFESNEVEETSDELVFESNEVEEASDEIVFESNEVEDTSDEIVFESNEVEEISDEIVFESNEVEDTSDEIVFESNDVEEISDEIVFDSNEVEETSDEIVFESADVEENFSEAFESSDIENEPNEIVFENNDATEEENDDLVFELNDEPEDEDVEIDLESNETFEIVANDLVGSDIDAATSAADDLDEFVVGNDRGFLLDVSYIRDEDENAGDDLAFYDDDQDDLFPSESDSIDDSFELTDNDEQDVADDLAIDLYPSESDAVEEAAAFEDVAVEIVKEEENESEPSYVTSGTIDADAIVDEVADSLIEVEFAEPLPDDEIEDGEEAEASDDIEEIEFAEETIDETENDGSEIKGNAAVFRAADPSVAAPAPVMDRDGWYSIAPDVDHCARPSQFTKSKTDPSYSEQVERSAEQNNATEDNASDTGSVRFAPVEKKVLADEFWLVTPSGSGYFCWKLEGYTWRQSSYEEFLGGDVERSTIVWAHGYQTDMGSALDAANVFRGVIDRVRSKQTDPRPYRLVVWKWASERYTPRIRIDARQKAALADYNGVLLGRFIGRLPNKNDVSFVGFSFGARVVGSALQTLATEQNQYASRSEEDGARGRVSLVLISAACDSCAFGSYGPYKNGAALASRVLNVYNPKDSALAFYPSVSTARTSALGLAPVSDWGESAFNLDVETSVGRKHSFVDEIRVIPDDMLNYLLF